MVLTSTQKKQLRALAHHLDPIVYVGQNGITDALLQAAKDALEAHELVKVKFVDFKSDRKELTTKITEATGSELAGIIGNIAILYKQSDDPKKQKIAV